MGVTRKRREREREQERERERERERKRKRKGERWGREREILSVFNQERATLKMF